MQFRRTQSSFRLHLFPVNITEGLRRVGDFITIDETTSAATAGECDILDLNSHPVATAIMLEHYLHACGSAMDEICTLQAKIPLCRKVKNV